jgi:erythronate-4-phosphate dehydrogenase
MLRPAFQLKYMKFVIDDKIPFIRGVIEKVGAEIIYISGAKFARENLVDADGIIIRTRTKCDEKLLCGSKVKFIASATIGFDHIDTEYCARNGIFWTNAAGCNSSSVAQYLTSALLNWAVEKNIDLRALTIGIIGVGNVGSKVAKIADALGMRTLLNDPPRQRKEGGSFSSLKQIFEEADIISLHVPLEYHGPDKTYHLADRDFFCEIRKKILFINTSRGEVAETDVLKEFIKNGKISNAIIDVWEDEPKIDRDLLALAKFATPHIAGYSTDGKANGTAMSVRAASQFFNFGLNEWFPEDIPLPEKNEIILSDSVSELEKLRQAVNYSYDIRGDDSRLRTAPEDFEKLREIYPIRREFTSYFMDENKISSGLLNILRRLGFRTKKLKP